MRIYTKSPLKRDSNHVIFHVGTNGLRSSQDLETIAKKIERDIAKNSKNDKNDILISNIVPRRDILNRKGCQVNKYL